MATVNWRHVCLNSATANAAAPTALCRCAAAVRLAQEAAAVMVNPTGSKGGSADHSITAEESKCHCHLIVLLAVCVSMCMHRVRKLEEQ